MRKVNRGATIPETRPRRGSGRPNLASGVATTMSDAKTSPAPAPTAGPFTAAMIGLGNTSISSSSSLYWTASRYHWSSASLARLLSWTSCRSIPEQNAEPAPVKITARTLRSWCRSSNACFNWTIIQRDSAFRLSARCNTTVPLGTCLRTRIKSSIWNTLQTQQPTLDIQTSRSGIPTQSSRGTQDSVTRDDNRQPVAGHDAADRPGGIR